MSVLIDFNGYGTLADLDTHADWANLPTPQGILTVGSGEVWCNSSGMVALCRYVGHTFNANHSSEVTFDVVSTGSAGTAHGCAVRLQSGSHSGYYVFAEPSTSGAIYLGVMNNGTPSYPLSDSRNTANSGAKLRLTATGVGSATRLTVEHNDGIGGGWVTVMANVDPGIYFDGGSPGIVGYNNSAALKINDVTFTGEVVTGGAMTGSTSLTFTPTATIKGTAAPTGTTSLAFTPTGTLKGAGTLTGTASLTLGQAATIKGIGALSGPASLTFTLDATLTGLGPAPITGSTSIIFDLTGVMGPPPVAAAIPILTPVMGPINRPLSRRRRVFLTLMSSGTRTGGGGASGPPSVTGLILWLKADSLALANNDLVGDWPDQSGVGNNFSEVTPSLKPVFHTNQVNGLPAIYFPLFTNNGLTMTAAWKPATPTAGECFAVCKADADPGGGASSGGIWRFGTAGFWDHITLNDGHVYLGWGRTARPDIGDLAPNFAAWRRLNIWSAPNDYSFQVDAVNVYSTAVNAVGFIAQPLLSRGGVVYVGHIAEYIQYNRKLTAGERTTVDNYLKAKYALT